MKNIWGTMLITVLVLSLLVLLFCFYRVHAAASDNGESITISATHVWDDSGTPGNRGKVTFHLAWSAGSEAGQTETRTIPDTVKEKQTVSWRDLPATLNGEKIQYYISVEPTDGYTVEVSGNASQGFTVIDHFTGESHETAAESTDITVSAVWKDAKKSDRDSVTVWLLADDEKTGEKKVLSSKNHWTAEFKELKLTKKGKSINYSVMEDVPSGYICMIRGNPKEGFTIMNKNIEN